ncbi:MAG: response regulator [Kofleriaceae bacterium]
MGNNFDGAGGLLRAHRNILIVDDDRDLRESLRELLEDHGHRAVDVEDGAQALAFLRQHGACLVLLDWHLAPMSAPELKAVLDDDPALRAIPVVIVSADLRLDRAALAGYAGHLAKPVDLVALFDAIECHCGGEVDGAAGA